MTYNVIDKYLRKQPIKDIEEESFTLILKALIPSLKPIKKDGSGEITFEVYERTIERNKY